MEVTDFFLVKLGQQTISGIGKSACADTSYFRQSGDKMFLRKFSHHSQIFTKKTISFSGDIKHFRSLGEREYTRHLSVIYGRRKGLSEKQSPL